MISSQQAGKVHKTVEEVFSPANSSDKYGEGTSEPGETHGTNCARISKTTCEDKQQGKLRETARLSMLPDMPLDILYEVRKSLVYHHPLIRRGSQIFSLVHPRDLMWISWTSKILDEFLTTKSSRHVWQASFGTIPKNENPPPCPSAITEMAYANLLYGPGYMVCRSVVNRLARPCNPKVAES